MAKFILSTDSNADMPLSYYEEHQIPVIIMAYYFNDDEIIYEIANDENIKAFYDELRAGKMSKTIQTNQLEAEQFFEKIIEERKGEEEIQILHLSFSSGLSGTYNNVYIAAQQLMQKYPNVQIKVLDTLTASMGVGLYLDYARSMRDQGMSLEETFKILEDQKQNLCSYFTVNDLHHLKRGGRVSAITAVIGSALGIKPVLHVDEAGKLINIGKVRGRQQALSELVNNYMKKKGTNIKDQTIFISHGDCEDDAKFVASLVKKEFGVKNVIINAIGPVVGTHSGPGTVAMFFMGTDRKESK